MPTKIRLQRRGRKKRPFYHIVIADGRAPRDGKYIESIGTYNPLTTPATIDLDQDKALNWLKNGAQPTETVRTILKHKGVMYRMHLNKGVAKGALTQEQADEKFQTWLKEKEEKIQSKITEVRDQQKSQEKERFDAETKLKEDRLKAIAERKAKELEAEVKEKAAEQEAEETIEEENEDPVAENNVEEKAEEAVEEKKEEPKEEPKEE